MTRSLADVTSVVGNTVLRRLATPPWTQTIGIARSVLACGTALTLLANPTWILFRSPTGGASAYCGALGGHLSLFCIVPSSQLDVARAIAVALLLVVASGWRPRLTGLFHWWVSYSFYVSGRVTDGGEQVTALITFLLLPAVLTDPRTWHWRPPARVEPQSEREALSRLVAYTALCLIQLQVSVIYLDACIEKIRVAEWLDGTVMYYVLTNNLFGPMAALKAMLLPLLSSPLVVAVTWPSLILEFLLGINIVLSRPLRGVLFVAGVLFHAIIAALIGIPTFAMAMWAVLLLGVLPIGTSLRRAIPKRHARFAHNLRVGAPAGPLPVAESM